jgi:hypothetical protein
MASPEEKGLRQGIQLTALDKDYRENPYQIFRELRERAPVHEDREMGRFLCSAHDDVKAICHDKEFFTDPRKANPGTFARDVLAGRMGFGEKLSMLFMDEPDHRRLRNLVSAPFKPQAVERWRPHVADIVQRTLDAIEQNEFDLVEKFAGIVPTVVIAEMLGIDPEEHGRFKEWSDLVIQVGFNPLPTEEQLSDGDKARQQLDELFMAEIAKRREQPGQDLLSDMIRAEEAGDSLTVQEIIEQCRLLLIAGNVTTTDLIGNGVNALLEHPEQLQKLRDQPDLIGNAVEEMLRYDSPVLNTGRIMNRDVSVAGCPLKKGSSVAPLLAAANRDPAVYPEPDKFDIERADTHHQSFGGGRHLCLGAHLARMEAQEAILGLLRRYPGLEKSPRGHTYHAMPTFRGFSEYWVRSR